MVVVVGHRANSGRIVFWYKRMGVRYVEVDVNLGDDGSIVVRHGPPGTRRATIIGRVWAWLDYKFFYRDPLLRTQPLRVWLERIQEEIGVEGVLLDLKTRVDPEALAREVEASGFSGELLVSANDHRLLPLVKRALPRARTAASFNVRPVDPIGCARPAEPDIIGVRHDFLEPELIDEVHRAGYKVSTWTVNDPEKARLLAMAGVDYIITDRPDIILRALARGLSAPRL